MADKTYGTLVTDRGILLIAAAVMEGKKINLTTLAVGDGGGAYYQPTQSMTALKNQVWSGNVKSVTVNADSPNMIDVVAIVPSDVGGWTIREMGVLDDTGTLIAVCNTPDTEKVIISSGAAGEIELTMHIEIANAENVTMIIDPHVITATKKDIEDHNEDPNAHGGLLKEAASMVEELASRVVPIVASVEEPTEPGPLLWLKVIQQDDLDPRPDPEEPDTQAVRLDIQDYRKGSDLYVEIDEETKSVENAKKTDPENPADDEPLKIRLT